jgi:predicted type IV restriction endonuclease
MPVDIRRPLKKFIALFSKAREANLNEADTSTHIERFLEEVLGYDVLTEITKEQKTGGGKIDLAVRIDGQVHFLVEVKKAKSRLNEQHLRQTKHYALDEGVSWAVLTNGVTWQLYHITLDGGTQCDRVFTVDLAEGPMDRLEALLGLLHRASVRRNKLEAYWKEQTALNPESVRKALFQEDVLRMIRRKIKAHKGIVVGMADLAGAIHSMFSEKCRLEMGPPKVITKIAGRKKQQPAGAAPANAAAAGAGLDS